MQLLLRNTPTSVYFHQNATTISLGSLDFLVIITIGVFYLVFTIGPCWTNKTRLPWNILLRRYYAEQTNLQNKPREHLCWTLRLWCGEFSLILRFKSASEKKKLRSRDMFNVRDRSRSLYSPSQCSFHYTPFANTANLIQFKSVMTISDSSQPISGLHKMTWNERHSRGALWLLIHSSHHKNAQCLCKHS